MASRAMSSVAIWSKTLWLCGSAATISFGAGTAYYVQTYGVDKSVKITALVCPITWLIFVVNGLMLVRIVFGPKLVWQFTAYRHYDALMNGMPDFVCVLDREGRITQTNPAAEAITGYSGEELRLIHSATNLFLKPRDGSAGDHWFEQAKHNVKVACDLELLHKNGFPVSVSVTTIPVVVRHQVIAVMAVAKDISAFKSREEWGKTQKLGIAGQLAAGVAHEIRNPLTTVKGFFQLVRKGLVSGDLYTIIDSEIAEIEAIVNKFLLLATHPPLPFKRSSMSELLGHALHMVQAQARKAGVKVETSLAQHTPEIVCNEHGLKQVFALLLHNAIASMSGPGTVKLELTRSGDWEVLVRITDEGEGMSDELMARLGEPYYSTKMRGTGLGAMVCFKIVQDHKGTIRYKRGERKGMIVEVTLPVR
jgi:two-component system sporulation sensor kinase A